MLRDEVGQLGQRHRLELDLRLHQLGGHVLTDRHQQPLEQQERFLLIFVDRLLLGIAPEVDHLAQRVERREMLLPVMVERLDQHLLFDVVPAVLLKLLELRSHGVVSELLQPLGDHFRIDRFLLDPLVDRRLEAKHFVDRFLEPGDIPLFRIRPLGAADRDDRGGCLGAHVDDRLADAFGVHDVGALLVDDLALVIHHVVEFDDLLADVVVARLDLLLRGLDRLGDPRRDDRLAILQVALHQA